MDPRNKEKLRQRVIAAAENALQKRQYVTAIDVLLGIYWLTPADVAAWRAGRLRHLEGGMKANLSKVSHAMSLFRVWARERKLKPSETVYKSSRGGGMRQFSVSGNPSIERLYRTHYVSPALSQAKRAEQGTPAPVIETAREGEQDAAGPRMTKRSPDFGYEWGPLFSCAQRVPAALD